MKTLAALILISAILVAAFAVLMRPRSHPLLIAAEYGSKRIAPCPRDPLPAYPNPLRPTRKADA